MNTKPLLQDPVSWIGLRFLDPLGRTFLYDGQYYKAIYPERLDEAKALFQSPAVRMLTERNLLVPAKEAPFALDGYPLVYALETDYFSFARDEWGVEQIRDAAIRYCEMGILLAQQGLGFIDGHSGNFVVMNNSQAKWCDTGSIIPCGAQELTGIDEFIRYFVYPLLVRASSPKLGRMMRFFFRTGCSHDEAESLLGKQIRITRGSRAHVFAEFKQLLEDLRFPFEDTLWSQYHGGNTPPEHPSALPKGTRQEVLFRLIQSQKARHILDFGANEGYYSLIGAASGAEVLAYEPDEAAAARCHAHFRSASPAFRVKVANAGIRGHGERPADLVLALALTHHLYFTHMCSFEVIAKMLAESTTKTLITEYMPNGLGIDKPHINPLPEGYALPVFLDHLSKRFRKVRLTDYENYAHRKLIIAKK